MILSDGVVLLRPRTLADVDAQVAGQDEEIVKWLDWEPPTIANVTDMIEASTTSWRDGMRRYDFGICDSPTGVLIGNALANCVDPLLGPGEVNIAYAVFPGWRGSGVAGRVVDLLCGWLRDDFRVHTAVLKIDEANAASHSVARRLGFMPSGSVLTDTGPLERFVRPLRP
jgi:RimJ/RimL family protein N-acetyltransferase